MDLDSRMDAYLEARKDIWGAFSLPGDMVYAIHDMRDYPWCVEDGDIWWWEKKDPSSEDEPEYFGELYGNSFWSNETHSLAVLWDEGEKPAFLFLNSKRRNNG